MARSCASSAAGNISDERYMTLGFDYAANLDDGRMWPTAFALTDLNARGGGKDRLAGQKAVS
jgi:hypothetical protein